MVHNEVAGLEVSVGIAGWSCPAVSRPAVGPAPAGDLLFADYTDPEPVRDEPAMDADGKHRGLENLECIELGHDGPRFAE